MKIKIFLILLCFLIGLNGGFSQTKPNDFPEDDTPSATDAFYTQEGDIARKIYLSVLKEFYSDSVDTKVVIKRQTADTVVLGIVYRDYPTVYLDSLILPIGGSADNLGNHIATQNIQLSNNKATGSAPATNSSDLPRWDQVEILNDRFEKSDSVCYVYSIAGTLDTSCYHKPDSFTINSNKLPSVNFTYSNTPPAGVSSFDFNGFSTFDLKIKNVSQSERGIMTSEDKIALDTVRNYISTYYANDSICSVFSQGGVIDTTCFKKEVVNISYSFTPSLVAPTDTTGYWVDENTNNGETFKVKRWVNGRWTFAFYWNKTNDIIGSHSFMLVGYGQSRMAMTGEGFYNGGDSTTSPRIISYRDIDTSWQTWYRASGANRGGVDPCVALGRRILKEHPNAIIQYVKSAFPGRPVDDFIPGGVRYEDLIEKIDSANVTKVDAILYFQGSSNRDTSRIGSCGNCKGQEAHAWFHTALVDSIIPSLYAQTWADTSTLFLFGGMSDSTKVGDKPKRSDRNGVGKNLPKIFSFARYLDFSSVPTVDGVHFDPDHMDKIGDIEYQAIFQGSVLPKPENAVYVGNASDSITLDLSKKCRISNAENHLIEFSSYLEGEQYNFSWTGSDSLELRNTWITASCGEIRLPILLNSVGNIKIERRNGKFQVIGGEYTFDLPTGNSSIPPLDTLDIAKNNNIVESPTGIFTGTVGGSENFGVFDSVEWATDSLAVVINVTATAQKNAWIGFSKNNILSKLTGLPEPIDFGMQVLHPGSNLRYAFDNGPSLTIGNTPITLTMSGTEQISLTRDKAGIVRIYYRTDGAASWQLAYTFTNDDLELSSLWIKMQLASSSTSIEYPVLQYYSEGNCPDDPFRKVTLKEMKDSIASRAFGGFSFVSNGTEATSTLSTPVIFDACNTSATLLNKFEFTEDRLTYTGKEIANIKVSLDITLSGDATVRWGLYFAKNGSIISNSDNEIETDGTGTNRQNFSNNYLLQLSENDYIELFYEKLNGSGSHSLNIFAGNLSITEL